MAGKMKLSSAKGPVKAPAMGGKIGRFEAIEHRLTRQGRPEAAAEKVAYAQVGGTRPKARKKKK